MLSPRYQAYACNENGDTGDEYGSFADDDCDVRDIDYDSLVM